MSVACWSTRDWRAMQAWARRHRVRLPDAAAAFTNIRQLQIQVSPYVCEMLAAVVAHRPAGLLSTSFALGVLAHESAHAAGTRAEGVAECLAVKTLPRVARMLGFSAATARIQQRVFRGTIYPAEPPAYRTPPCHVGLPGLVVRDEVGPAKLVQALRVKARRLHGAFAGWRLLPPVLPGQLDPCAAIRSRTQELARVSGGYVRGRRLSAIFGLVTLPSARILEATWTREPRAFACTTAEQRGAARRSDPHAVVVRSPLPSSLTALSTRVRGYRLTLELRAHTVIQDSLVVKADATRFYGVVIVYAVGVPPPLGVEIRAARVLLRSD